MSKAKQRAAELELRILTVRNNYMEQAADELKESTGRVFDLQERGSLFIGHGVEVYEGMIIGINSRDNDLMVNPTKGKQLTNVRTQGADEKIILSPPIRFSLEQALEFIDDDELVEVTPTSVRLRKKLLTENERKRESRKAADG